MSSTLTDRPSAITLTTAEQVALTAHAVGELYPFTMLADYEGDPTQMLKVAGELIRAARLTTAAQAGELPADLHGLAGGGLVDSIDDARKDVAHERRCRDAWRTGARDGAWPELSDEQNAATLDERVEEAEGRLAGLESLASKLEVR